MPRASGNLIGLSPSALDDFGRCPRCFWLSKNHKITKPRGAFPTLPSGVDRALKAYLDEYRQRGEMPAELAKITGRLYPNQQELAVWRDWRTTDLCYVDAKLGVRLSGALDDLIIEPDGLSPLDYKTRGYPHKDGADPFEYYRGQLNDYALMLHAKGHPVSGRAYLAYYIPSAMHPLNQQQNGPQIWGLFDVCVYEMAVDLDAAKDRLQRAVECLRGPLPDVKADCEVCPFVSKASTKLAALLQGAEIA